MDRPPHTQPPQHTPLPLGDEPSTHKIVEGLMSSEGGGTGGFLHNEAEETMMGGGSRKGKAVAAGVHPQQQTFLFCNSKIALRRMQNNISQHSRPVLPGFIESEVPGSTNELQKKIDGTLRVPGNNVAAPVLERSDPRNRTLLQNRQFVHSQRAQPMAMEQVLSDRDSEDEVDDDVADLYDRRMLDDFVDVTEDEKHLMRLWNSFVRKQRVLADGHVPWACEAFTKLHGPDFMLNPGLLLCWRMSMVRLWDLGLLDPGTINNCNIAFEKLQNQAKDPRKYL